LLRLGWSHGDDEMISDEQAIEWFNLDPEEMSASENKGEPVETDDTASAPKTVAKKLPPPAEKGVPNAPLKFRLDKLVREHPYLEERGLTLETLVDFGVGYCTKGTMAERIAIPIHNVKGEVLAYAGRYPYENPPEDTPKYKLPPGFRKSQELFNLDRAIKEPADKPLLIVEGFFDCMKIHQHGYKKVVALMGSTLSATQEELIRQHPKHDSHIIVMLDENEAGRAGREDIVCRLSKFCFVRVHQFEQPDMEPEHLSDDQLADIVEGVV